MADANQAADPLSMPHFRRLLDNALERVWWAQSGASYRKTVDEFNRCERERSHESYRLESYQTNGDPAAEEEEED